MNKWLQKFFSQPFQSFFSKTRVSPLSNPPSVHANTSLNNKLLSKINKLWRLPLIQIEKGMVKKSSLKCLAWRQGNSNKWIEVSSWSRQLEHKGDSAICLLTLFNISHRGPLKKFLHEQTTPLLDAKLPHALEGRLVNTTLVYVPIHQLIGWSNREHPRLSWFLKHVILNSLLVFDLKEAHTQQHFL